MNYKFNIGDKVIINSLYKDSFTPKWYKKWNGKLLTIKKYSEFGGSPAVYFKEMEWKILEKHLMLYDFISEEEMSV